MSTNDIIDEFDAAFDEEANREFGLPSNDNEDSREEPENVLDSEDTESPEDNRPEENTEAKPEENEPNKWEEEYNKMQQRMRSWEGRIEAERNKRVEAERMLQELMAKKEEQQEQEEEEAPLPEWTKFKEEYDDLAAPIEAFIQAQISRNVGKVEAKLAKTKKDVDASFNEHAMTSHYAKISNAHPDWEAILSSGELDAWKESLSPFEQRGIDAIIERGTTEQIIDMFDYYKRANNKQTKIDKKPAGLKEGMSPLNEDELVKKVVAALAVTSGKSTSPSKIEEDIPDDFDKAFEYATRNEK